MRTIEELVNELKDVADNLKESGTINPVTNRIETIAKELEENIGSIKKVINNIKGDNNGKNNF